MLKGTLRNSRPVRFALSFIGYIAVFALIFNSFEGVFSALYLRPISLMVSGLLEYFGVKAPLDLTNLAFGFCDVVLAGVTHRITHSCTGLFTCLIFAAGVLAYPAPINRKLRGLAIGIPAFFAFGTVRLVFMGAIAISAPDYIPLFHRFILVMIGAGYALFLWVWWVDKVKEYERTDTLSA